MLFLSKTPVNSTNGSLILPITPQRFLQRHFFWDGKGKKLFNINNIRLKIFFYRGGQKITYSRDLFKLLMSSLNALALKTDLSIRGSGWSTKPKAILLRYSVILKRSLQDKVL